MGMDPWQDLKRKYALRDRRRIATPQRQVSSGSLLVPSASTSTVPAGTPAAEGKNSQTFLVGGVMTMTRINVAPYTPTPAWPPDGQYLGLSGTPPPEPINEAYGQIQKDLVIGGDNNASFWVSICGLKWDTSALPDDAAITGATLRLTAALSDAFGGEGGKWDMEGRSINADWTAWTGITTDWTVDVGTNAVSAVAIASTPASGEYELALLNAAANVSRTGTTYLRLGISGGAPTRKFNGRMGTSPGVNSYNSISFAGNADPDDPGVIFSTVNPARGPKLTVRYS